MSKANLKGSEFLIAPTIHRHECLRGYLSRVTERNNAMALMRPMLSSLPELSYNLDSISKLTRIKRSVLAGHGSLIYDSDDGLARMRIGNDSVPDSMFWVKKRQFCSLCLASANEIPVYWALIPYSVCHRHKVQMVNCCGNCGASYEWGSGTYGACTCGQRMVMETPRPASSKHAVTISMKIAMSALRSLDDLYDHDGNEFLGGVYSIRWTLLLLEFIQHVLIRSKWESRHPGGVFTSIDLYQGIVATLLNDEDYCKKIHGAMLAHVAANPELLQIALKPRNGSRSVRTHFLNCAAMVGDHKGLKRLPRGKVVLQKKTAPAYGPRDRQRASDPGGITCRPRRIVNRPADQTVLSILRDETMQTAAYYSEPELIFSDLHTK